MGNKCYVYQHKFPNGKSYFGITIQNPEKRWGYGCNYQNNARLTNAIKKYGWENIEHIILFECENSLLAEQKEKELIKKFKTNEREFGYNIALGGVGALGYKHTDEAKRKISERAKQKRKPLSKEHIQKIIKNTTGKNNPNYGKPRSEKTKQKIRNALLGKKHSAERIKNQIYSKKDLILLDFNGEKLPVSIVAEKLNISASTIYRRLKRGESYGR